MCLVDHVFTILYFLLQTVGTVCRLLPWHQYETILRFYLAKLRYQVDFQKQLVRTVVAILDAFHFDLSRAQISAVQDTSENKEVGDVELMQVEVEVSVNSISDPSESVMTVPINKSHAESGETGVPNSAKDDAGKNVEDAGHEELVERLESLLDLEDVTCEVEEKECDATCEMASASLPAVNRDTVLNKSVATYVIQTITTGLLPQIHRVMAQLTQEELSHKVNKKQTALDKEDEGILRVPIALAAVKLLQCLPSHMLDQNLPG
jgi:U3 small nucleolar RNA-associated protein 20